MSSARRGVILFTAAVFVAIVGTAWAGSVQPMSLAEVKALLQAQNRSVAVLALASWCGPCMEELPRLNRLYLERHARGLEEVALSLDIAPEAMDKALARRPVDFPVYWIGEQGLELLNTMSIPLLILVRDGRELGRFNGARNDSQLRELFDLLDRK